MVARSAPGSGGDNLSQKADLLISTMGVLASSQETLSNDVKQLAEATEVNTATIAKVDKKSQRSREFIYGIIVSVVFDIAMSVGFGILAVQAHRAADKANDSLHTQKISCDASNISRSDNKQVWHDLFDFLTEDNKITPEQLPRLKVLSDKITIIFAPRDCNQILKSDVTVTDLTPTVVPSSK